MSAQLLDRKPSGILTGIFIRDLFGQYTYNIDLSEPSSERKQTGRQISLLYGDNGAGKTTILNLVWHLMSSLDGRGHRTFLALTPFKEFCVSLSNGDSIAVKKNDGLVSSYNIIAGGETGQRIRQQYVLEDGRIPVRSGDTYQEMHDESGRRRTLPPTFPDRYIRYLANLDLVPRLLADDRQIYGDDIAESKRYEDEYSRLRRTLAGGRETDNPHGVLARELESAIDRVNHMIGQLVISGNTSGSQSSDSIYLDLLTRIAKSDEDETETEPIEKVRERIIEVGERMGGFSEFDLSVKLKSDLFLNALSRIKEDRIDIASSLLTPYLDMQKARLDALQGVETLIRTLVGEINAFFDRKTAVFSLGKGLRIVSDEGMVLQPHQLSSGERQILLLLLNTVLAQQGTGLFLVDEPEISLNVKWQRRLIESLLACARNSSVQFIIATHSIEIITGNTHRLARLEPEEARRA